MKEFMNMKFSSLDLTNQIDFFIENERDPIYHKNNSLVEEIKTVINSKIFLTESDIFLAFSKVINNSDSPEKCLNLLMIFRYLERVNYFEEKEMYFILYEQIVLIKLESTKIHHGKRSEKVIFSAKNFKIESYLPSIKNKIYNYNINGKFADLIGDCKLTGKKIIVEFKKGNRCGSLQLFGYAKVLGCENNCILVNVSESEVKKKQKGIVYLTNK